MPVMVTFPDGEEREVPSHDEFTPSREIGAAADAGIHVETPDYDPQWAFRAGLGGSWTARARR